MQTRNDIKKNKIRYPCAITAELSPNVIPYSVNLHSLRHKVIVRILCIHPKSKSLHDDWLLRSAVISVHRPTVCHPWNKKHNCRRKIRVAPCGSETHKLHFNKHSVAISQTDTSRAVARKPREAVQISIRKASGELHHTEVIAIKRENSHFRRPHFDTTSPTNPDEYRHKHRQKPQTVGYIFAADSIYDDFSFFLCLFLLGPRACLTIKLS